MKRQYFLLMALLMAISQVAMASEVCSTLQDCLNLKAKLENRILELQIGDSVLGDFLRDRNGKIITYHTQIEASEACNRQGMRLPTAREVALEGVRYGAVLLELSDYNAGRIPAGYSKDDFTLKTPTEADWSSDIFYYSYRNYNRQPGDLIKYWIWTSSINHPTYEFNENFYYFFVGSGLLGISDRLDHDDGAVRCVPK